jgi:hypothetical protein
MDRDDNHYPTMTIGGDLRAQGAGRRSQSNTIDIGTGVFHCGCVRVIGEWRSDSPDRVSGSKQIKIAKLEAERTIRR